jgi:hypothetical protein
MFFACEKSWIQLFFLRPALFAMRRDKNPEQTFQQFFPGLLYQLPRVWSDWTSPDSVIPAEAGIQEGVVPGFT